MGNPLLQKCALLALIGALLLIPLSMIERTINERTMHRAEAIRTIAASTAGEQSISGPLLTVPVEEEYDDEQIEESNGERRKKTIRRKRTHPVTVLPRQLHFDGALNVEKRAYGLYETAVFELQGVITGSFETPGPAALPPLGQNASLSWGTPSVSVGIADTRGITGEPKIALGGKLLGLHRGSKASGLKTGFHALAGAPHDGKGRNPALPRRPAAGRHRQRRLRSARRNLQRRIARQLAASELRRRLPAAQPRDRRRRFHRAVEHDWPQSDRTLNR